MVTFTGTKEERERKYFVLKCRPVVLIPDFDTIVTLDGESIIGGPQRYEDVDQEQRCAFASN